MKTERLLNLVIALLSTRMPLSKARIRAAVPQYHGTASDEAFDRMFERDKDELRELGIPLVTSVIDPVFDDELGYRIDKREYALPEISFEPDEVAALSLAARTWTRASLAGPAATGAAQAAGRRGRPWTTPRSSASSRWSAPPRRRSSRSGARCVTGAPSPSATASPTRRAVTRHLQPWGLAQWHGRWYLTGFDLDRGAARVFRRRPHRHHGHASGPDGGRLRHPRGPRRPRDGRLDPGVHVARRGWRPCGSATGAATRCDAGPATWSP